MATVYSYHYTIDAYVNWTDAYVTDEVINIIGIIGQYDSAIYPTWIKVQDEADKKTTPHTIQKGYTIKWRARFYAKKVVNGGTPQYWWLNDDVVKNVHVSLSAYKDKVANTSPGVRTDKSGVSTAFKTGGTGASYFTVQNPTGGCTFTWWTKPTQSNFKLNPAFTLTADIDLGSNYNDYGGDPDTSIKHPTLLPGFVNPAFSVYDAKPTPNVPPVLTDNLQAFAYSAGSGTGAVAYAFSRCCNEWRGLAVTARTATAAGKISYKFKTVTCAANGTNLVDNNPKGTTENAPNNSLVGIDGPQVKAARAELQKHILADCNSGLICGNGKPTSGNGGGTTPPPNTNPNGKVAPDLRWNPPPHKFSRDRSFGERLLSNIQVSTFPQDNYLGVKDINVVRQAFAAGERGRIFQDKAGADILNTNPDKLNLPTGGQYPKQWGFRFMYNPNEVQYSTSANTSIDWTIGAKDPATLLAGNQSVNFQLFINRIADMKWLTDYSTKQAPVTDWNQAYGRTLDITEIEGLLNRGTEYDIEFLYRVLNGDPLKNPLLFNPSYKGVTSDFGYTTGVPCWLYLNENLRYYGSIAGFTVTHIMFDLNMVPILSTVGINFVRYPALWNDTAAVAGGASATAAALKKSIVDKTLGTANTPTS